MQLLIFAFRYFSASNIGFLFIYTCTLHVLTALDICGQTTTEAILLASPHYTMYQVHYRFLHGYLKSLTSAQILTAPEFHWHNDITALPVLGFLLYQSGVNGSGASRAEFSDHDWVVSE